MSKSDLLLRGQINKLEGSLKSARDKNSKDSSKKKDLEVNYADMTLILADVSNKMDSDRFEVKYDEQQNRKSANEESQASDKNQNALTNEEFCDIEPYEDLDESDAIPYPSMKRFGALMPTLNETESQIDLRDFNDLDPPDAAANSSTEYKQSTESGYTRDLSSDRGEDEDTPQQEYNTGLSSSYPLPFDYSRECSEEYDAPTANRDYGKPTALFRNRTRSKTLADNPFKGTNPPNKSSRSYSQADPSIQVSFEEHYYTEDTQMYAKPSLVQTRDTYRSEPIYDDNQLEDYNPNTLSPLSLNLIGSISSNHSDSDSDFDNFIYQRQEGNPQPVEEMRAKSPYFQQPASKSALGSYPQVEKSMSPHPPEVAMRQKSRNQEQHKRLTMPQSAANYEVPAANSRKSPNPYSKYKISTANPTDGKLLFRSFQSARDASPYDTVLSARKASTPNYGPNPAQYDPETEAYTEAEERQVHSRQPSLKANFNRNKSTNHRNYVSQTRQEIVSPASPPMEVEYDDDVPYETTVNAAEIMNRHPQLEFPSPHHYANLQHSAPRPAHRQQPVSRHVYAAPHTNYVTPANRNHAYVPTHDTSPVQSLDSGIASLYNDISYRPRTAAAQVSHYNSDFDYEEAPVEDEPNMEELVLQLRNELRLLSSKIQRFEDQSVVPTQQVMSPTGQKYPVYAPSQLRSSSVASSGSEGGRAKQGPQSPKMTSPNMSRSPMPIQAKLPPRHPHQSQEYGVEYATPPSPSNKDRAVGIPQSNRLKKQLLPQSSTPNINRPSSVSKFASNSSQSRISNGIPRPAPPPIRPVQHRPQGSNVPRAQSSTGTATYTSLPTPRLQTPRYTPGPQIYRSTSPLPPKTSARKPVPPRPTHSSRSNRGPDGYHYDEESLKQPSHIPNPTQRYHY